MESQWVAMQIEGIRACQCDACACTGRPVLALMEDSGPRRLYVHIREAQARALAPEFEGNRTRHTLIYGLIEAILAGLGGRIGAVRVTPNGERGLACELQVTSERKTTWVPAHPDDAAALAWRLGIPVLVPAEIVPEVPPELSGLGEGPEDLFQIEEFRRFLDRVGPEDFGG